MLDKLTKEQLVSALQLAKNDEDWLVIHLECEHFELRKKLKDFNIEFNFSYITNSCREEIQLYYAHWNKSKILAYYNISSNDLYSILYCPRTETQKILEDANKAKLENSPLQDIADKYNVPVKRVERLLTRQTYKLVPKIVTKVRSAIKKGKSNKEIAEKFGISEARVSQIKRDMGLIASKEELIREAKRLKSHGKSQQSIAMILGTSQATVHRWLKRKL